MAALKNKESLKSGNGSGGVKFLSSGTNSIGVPDGQTPGYGRGTAEESTNQLPSNARVVKSATSNLMTGMSQTRGAGGAK